MNDNKKLEIHVGQMIEVYLRENNITKVAFSKLISCSRNNVYNILNSPNINTQTLQHICTKLNHDFFADISQSIAGCNESLDK